MSDVVRFRPVRRFRPAPVRPPRPTLPLRWLPLLLAIAAAVTLTGTQNGAVPVAKSPAVPVLFGMCSDARQTDCIIDGDTIRYRSVKIRIADIDAPEVFSPKCASERALGQRAAYRLRELMNAGPVQFVRRGDRDEDMYGRKLRVIERNGRSLGDILVAEGLARPWDGARRSWCG